MSQNTVPAFGDSYTLADVTHFTVFNAVFSNAKISVAATLDEALRDPVRWPYFAWTGEVAGDDAGQFWIPGLLSSNRLPAALDKLAERRKIAGKPYHRAACITSMARFHSGIGNAQVALFPMAYVEIDHLPRIEQEQRYAALAAATGLVWTLKVFTGGKSVHAYFAFSRPLEATDPLRLRIQKLLIAILEGDTRIVDLARLMRLPGWRGARKQPVVAFEPSAMYEPRELVQKLEDYARILGLEPDAIDNVLDVLHLAERLDEQAKHDSDNGNSDMALELREHAMHLRATRGRTSAADLALAHAMVRAAVGRPTPRTDKAAGASPSTGEGFRTLHWKAAASNSFTARSGDVVPVSTLAAFISNSTSPKPPMYCPAFAPGSGHEDNMTSCFAFAGNDGIARIHCSSCGTTFTPEADDDDLDVKFANDVIASIVYAPPTPPDPNLPTPPLSLLNLTETRTSELLEINDHVGEAIIADFDPASLHRRMSYEDYEDRNPRSEAPQADHLTLASGTSVDRSDVSAIAVARSRARALGDSLARCQLGPWHHHAGDGAEGRTARLACLSYGCNVCGPTVRAVLQAAAEVVVGRVIADGIWNAIVVNDLSNSGKTCIKRWAADTEGDEDVEGVELEHLRRVRLEHESAPERLHLTIATSPTSTSTLVLWQGNEHEPTGALSRHLLTGTVVADAVTAIGTVVAAVELNEWACAANDDGDRRRATVLRGCRWLKERIANVRDAVLGRSRARRQEGTERKTLSVRTYRRSGEQVREEVARRLATEVLAEVPEQHRAGARVEHWRTASGAPVRWPLEDMLKDGWFEGRERYYGRLEDPSAGMPLLTDLLGDDGVFVLMDFNGKRERLAA